MLLLEQYDPVAQYDQHDQSCKSISCFHAAKQRLLVYCISKQRKIVFEHFVLLQNV